MYQVEQQIAQLLNAREGAPRRLDGASLALSDLPALMMSDTLFGAAEPVVIKDLSGNTAVWQAFVVSAVKILVNLFVILVETYVFYRS